MAEYRKRAAEFNVKMGLDSYDDYWDDALIRFSVVGEEAGELLGAVNGAENLGEELADVVITLYTGADTLDIQLPEGADVDSDEFDFQFDDTEREIAGLIYSYGRNIFFSILMRDEDMLRNALVKCLYYCHIAADEFEVDLSKEFNQKMDYNMQKSGVKVNGKPVDDVESADD